MTAVSDTRPAADATLAGVLATADRVADELRSTAARRDRANGSPRDEIELLRENDLLQVQEPAEYGGSGLDYAQASQVTRRIARGAGRHPMEVGQLLQRFGMMRKVMKQIGDSPGLLTRLPGFRQIAQLMRAEAFAVQLLHMPSLAGEHAPHLMVTAFGDREARSFRRNNLQPGRETRLLLATQHEIALREDFHELRIKLTV